LSHLLLWIAHYLEAIAAGGPAAGSHARHAEHSPIDWPAWLTAIGTAVLAGGIVIAVFQLRELKRDRSLQWIFEMGRRWDNEKLEHSRVALRACKEEALAAKVARWGTPGFSAEEEVEMTELIRLPNFFEDVALMFEHGRLNTDLVWQTFSGPAFEAWEGWKASMPALREHDPLCFSEFEKLVAWMAVYVPKARTDSAARRWVGERAFALARLLGAAGPGDVTGSA
jgi:hypothetical protein